MEFCYFVTIPSHLEYYLHSGFHHSLFSSGQGSSMNCDNIEISCRIRVVKRKRRSRRVVPRTAVIYKILTLQD